MEGMGGWVLFASLMIACTHGLGYDREGSGWVALITLNLDPVNFLIFLIFLRKQFYLSK